MLLEGFTQTSLSLGGVDVGAALATQCALDAQPVPAGSDPPCCSAGGCFFSASSSRADTHVHSGPMFGMAK